MSSMGAPQAPDITSTPDVKLELDPDQNSRKAPVSLLTFNRLTLLQYIADSENLEYLLRVEPDAAEPYKAETEAQQQRGISCSYKLGKLDDTVDESKSDGVDVEMDGDILVASDTDTGM